MMDDCAYNADDQTPESSLPQSETSEFKLRASEYEQGRRQNWEGDPRGNQDRYNDHDYNYSNYTFAEAETQTPREEPKKPEAETSVAATATTGASVPAPRPRLHLRNKTYRRRTARAKVIAARKGAPAHHHRSDCQYYQSPKLSVKKRCSGGDAGADLESYQGEEEERHDECDEHERDIDINIDAYDCRDHIEEEVQIRDNITVIVRIRPRKKSEKVTIAKTLVKVLDERALLFDPKVSGEEFYFHGVKQKVHDCSKRPNKNISFVFDAVYGPKSTNVEIFETSLKPIVGHIIRGYSCSIFAYGATGSGKTFTMLGNGANPGLSFLMAMELYKRIGEIGNEYESEVVVSYLEVYNETLKDLLQPSDSLLSIRENGLNGVSIPNLTKHKPKDATAMLRLLSYGNNHRTQHPTDHNSESSRSHAIFEVGVSLRKKFTQLSVKYKMTKAKLVMIDLAGSERGNTATNANGVSVQGHGTRIREGSNINKSLLALGNCINALADGKKHVPYRDSKLTRILKDSLGGNCKTIMITNISPTSLSYDDTYNSLKYADRAKQIKITCKKNVLERERGPEGANVGGLGGGGHVECDRIIQDLHAEIVHLKKLVLHEKEATRALLSQKLLQAQHQQGVNIDGVGVGVVYNEGVEQFKADAKCSPFASQTQLVVDPDALENFIQLLSTKKKSEETHLEASLKAKEAEWAMHWREWRMEAIKALGRSGSQEQTHLMKTCLQRLRQELEQHSQTHTLCQEQVQLAKQVLDYNEKELDHLRRNGLASLKLEDPFLVVTLSEFLYFKALEREASIHKSMENHHMGLCSTLLNEVLQSETLLTTTLQFQQTLWRFVKENGLNPSEKCQQKYSEILQAAYGHAKMNILPSSCSSFVCATGTGAGSSSACEEDGRILIELNHKRRKQLSESAQALHKVLTDPALDYEPPPTTASTIQPSSVPFMGKAPPAFGAKITDSLSSIASSCTFTEISTDSPTTATRAQISACDFVRTCDKILQTQASASTQHAGKFERLQGAKLKMLTLNGGNGHGGHGTRPCICGGDSSNGNSNGNNNDFSAHNEICIMGTSDSIKTLLDPKQGKKSARQRVAKVVTSVRKKPAVIKPSKKAVTVKSAFGRTCPAEDQEEVKKKLDKVRQVTEEQKHAELGIIGIPVQKVQKSEEELLDEEIKKRMAKKKRLKFRADVARKRMTEILVTSSSSKESTATTKTSSSTATTTVLAARAVKETSSMSEPLPVTGGLIPKPPVIGRPFTRYKARPRDKVDIISEL